MLSQVRQLLRMVWKKQEAGKEFQYIPEGNWKVGDLFTDKLSYNKPLFKNGKIISYVSEMILPSQTLKQSQIDNRKMSEEHNPQISEAIRYNFGNRIPLQDKQSMLALEWVDTMPLYYGSTAIFPSEIIELSGADFDIDKEYITAADVYIDAKGEFKRYGSGETYKERFEEYRAWHLKNNRYLRIVVQSKQEESGEFQAIKARYTELRQQADATGDSLKGIGKDLKELRAEIDTMVGAEDYEDNKDAVASMRKSAYSMSISRKDMSEGMAETIGDITKLKEELLNLKEAFFEQAMHEMGLPYNIATFEELILK